MADGDSPFGATRFVIDCDIHREPLDTMRSKAKAGHYGKLSPAIMKGYVDMSGRTG